MSDAVKAMREFGETLERMIGNDEQRIAKRFASLHGSHVDRIDWATHDNGDAGFYVTLTDGHRLVGRGVGKLDALVDAEKDLPF